MMLSPARVTLSTEYVKDQWLTRARRSLPSSAVTRCSKHLQVGLQPSVKHVPLHGEREQVGRWVSSKTDESGKHRTALAFVVGSGVCPPWRATDSRSVMIPPFQTAFSAAEPSSVAARCSASRLQNV